MSELTQLSEQLQTQLTNHRPARVVCLWWPGQAALCCIRILRHLPEHVEDFMERIKEVLKDRHHGVLVAGVQLVTAVVEFDPKVC